MRVAKHEVALSFDLDHGFRTRSSAFNKIPWVGFGFECCPDILSLSVDESDCPFVTLSMSITRDGQSDAPRAVITIHKHDMNWTAALVLYGSACLGASKLCFFCFIFWLPQSFLAWKLASETFPTGWIHYYFLEEQIVDESSGQIVTT